MQFAILLIINYVLNTLKFPTKKVSKAIVDLKQPYTFAKKLEPIMSIFVRSNLFSYVITTYRINNYHN